MTAQILRSAFKKPIPFKNELRRIKRRLSGYKPSLPNLLWTIEDGIRQRDAIRAMGGALDGATVLEIGSGWFPLLPIVYALSGARQVLMTDIERYMDQVTFAETKNFALKNMDRLARDFGWHRTDAESRLRKAEKAGDLGIDYLAPFAPERVRDRSLDIVVSRTVLEHIPPRGIVELLRALRPKLKTGGFMVHVVDESDHFEHNDDSISRINFLTIADWKWSVINGLCDYQNRLRHHQYLPLFESAGYAVPICESSIDEPTRAAARTLPLVEPFRSMSPDEVSILHSVFGLKPA